MRNYIVVFVPQDHTPSMEIPSAAVSSAGLAESEEDAIQTAYAQQVEHGSDLTGTKALVFSSPSVFRLDPDRIGVARIFEKPITPTLSTLASLI